MVRLLLSLILLAGLAAAGLYGYEVFTGKPLPGIPSLKPGSNNGNGGGRGAGGRPIYVVTVPVRFADFADQVEVLGTLKARESITVTAKTTETISRVLFTDGQAVKAGDVIVEMTSSQQGAQIDEARANLAEAENQYQRALELFKSGNVSQSVLDQRKAARDSAAARLRNVESQRADRLMRAPFAGVLGLRQVSEGTLVRPGDIITTLDDISLMKADLGVPETALGLLKAGLPVEGRAAAFPAKTFTGTLTAIDSRVDPVSRTILARAELPNPDSLLKPGMLLSVVIKAAPRRSLAVPEDSIVPLGDKRSVYVAGADGKAELRPVVTGARIGGLVEIKSGLAEGDKVVTEGTIKLRPGAPITLTPPKTGGEGGRPDRGGRGGGRPQGPS